MPVSYTKDVGNHTIASWGGKIVVTNITASVNIKKHTHFVPQFENIAQSYVSLKKNNIKCLSLAQRTILWISWQKYISW